MRITVGALFLAFAVFLDFIESISSTRTLEQLFPDNNGALPRMEDVTYLNACELPNFQLLHNERIAYIRNSEITFLKRGNFIFGYINQRASEREYIKPVCEMFRLRNVLVVYDINEKQWEKLSEEALQEMGVSRNYLLVKTRDELFDDHELAHNEPQLDRQAHFFATRAANESIKQFEQNEARRMLTVQTTAVVSIRKIKEKYNWDYRQEYTRFKAYSRDNPDRVRNGRRIF